MKRLADLLRSRRKRILDSWARVVLEDPSVPMANRLPAPALRDHVPHIVDSIIGALDGGVGRGEAEEGRALAEAQMPREHAIERFEAGYTLAAALRELSHLRACMVDVYFGEPNLDPRGVRFLHAALDQCMSIAAVQMERAASRELESDRALLKEAANVREKFVAILGHDLRSPLNTIKMAGGILLTAGISEHQRSFVVRIVRAVDRMNRMIEELLDFSKARAGGLAIERRRVDLRALCHELVEELRVATPERTIMTSASGNLAGEWDEVRLTQVLSNLLANALAYSPPDSTVTLDVRDAGDEVVIEVHNEGSPIPKEATTTIFDPFRRASGDANPSGLGLGLYITAEIARAHGGTIAVDSDAGRGTTFTVHLPRPARS